MMTSRLEPLDLAEQNFRTRVTLGKLALAYRLCIARFAEKFNLQFRIVKKVEPRRQRKLATSIRQNMPQGSTEH